MTPDAAGYFSPLTSEQLVCLGVGVLAGVVVTVLAVMFVGVAAVYLQQRRQRLALRDSKILRGIRP